MFSAILHRPNILALHTFPKAEQHGHQIHENSTATPATMRWLLSLLLLELLAVVQAVSSSGSKLLVVLEELSDKTKYSKYFGDLEGRSSQELC
jgi:hypothetical protein